MDKRNIESCNNLINELIEVTGGCINLDMIDRGGYFSHLYFSKVEKDHLSLCFIQSSYKDLSHLSENSYHIESLEVQFKNLAFIFYKGQCSAIAIHGFNRTEEELISVFRNNRKGVRAGEFKHTYFDIGFFSKHTFSYNRTEDNYFEKYRTYFLTGHFYTSILLPKNSEISKMNQQRRIPLIINLKSIENKMNQIKDEFKDLYPLSKSKDDFISMYINRYRAIFESILKFIIAIRLEKRQDEQIDISRGMIGQLTAIIKEKKLISSKLIKTIESITKQYLNPHSHDKSKKIDHHPELIEKVHNKIYDFLVSIFEIPNSPDSFYESFRIESE